MGERKESKSVQSDYYFAILFARLCCVRHVSKRYEVVVDVLSEPSVELSRSTTEKESKRGEKRTKEKS